LTGIVSGDFRTVVEAQRWQHLLTVQRVNTATDFEPWKASHMTGGRDDI